MAFDFIHHDKIRGVRIEHPFPLYNREMKLTGYDSSTVNIYYYKDLVAYAIPAFHNIADLSAGYTLRYLVAHKDSSYGYYYTSAGKRRVLMDKVLSNDTWIKKIYGYEAFTDNIVKPVSSHYDSATGTLTEVVKLYAKKDTSMQADAWYIYSDKVLKDIGYSLSHQLDSIKKMKLVEIKILHPDTYLKDYQLTMDAFEQRYTLTEFPVKDEKVMEYFEKYSREH
jgi:hypothetical protein